MEGQSTRAQFASPAESMNDALASILSQRFGDGEIQTEISGVFAGPIEIPIPDEMKNPAKLMRFVGNTSFAMQLGRAAGDRPMRCAAASIRASRC